MGSSLFLQELNLCGIRSLSHEYTVILPINIGQHNLKFVQVCYKSSSTTELLIGPHVFLHVNYNQTELFLHLVKGVNRTNSSSRGFYAGSDVGFVV